MEFSEMVDDVKSFTEKMVSKRKFDLTDREIILARTVKLSEEVGELSDEVLKSMNLGRPGKKYSKDSISGELSDVIITAINLGITLNIDMEEEFKKRIKFITERLDDTLIKD